MPQLVNQPTLAPTRKWWVGAIAAFVVGGGQAVLNHLVPGLGSAIPGDQFIPILAGLFASYMARERAPG
jgi:hypothetical protein